MYCTIKLDIIYQDTTSAVQVHTNVKKAESTFNGKLFTKTMSSRLQVIEMPRIQIHASNFERF